MKSLCLKFLFATYLLMNLNSALADEPAYEGKWVLKNPNAPGKAGEIFKYDDGSIEGYFKLQGYDLEFDRIDPNDESKYIAVDPITDTEYTIQIDGNTPEWSLEDTNLEGDASWIMPIRPNPIFHPEVYGN